MKLMDRADIEAFGELVEIADRRFDGHMTIIKFTTNWRVSFGPPPNDRSAIKFMAEGKTFHDAATAASSVISED
jgi:hypothetical protein